MLFSLFRMRSGRSGLRTSGVRECDGCWRSADAKLGVDGVMCDNCLASKVKSGQSGSAVGVAGSVGATRTVASL